jgi:transposase
MLRLHRLEHRPLSEVCVQYPLNPNVFYRWQKGLFDHGTAAFDRAENGSADRTTPKLQKENMQLKAKLASKDAVISEIRAEQVRLKETLGRDGKRLGPSRMSAMRWSITSGTGANEPASVIAGSSRGSESPAARSTRGSSATEGSTSTMPGSRGTSGCGTGSGRPFWTSGAPIAVMGTAA